MPKYKRDVYLSKQQLKRRYNLNVTARVHPKQDFVNEDVVKDSHNSFSNYSIEFGSEYNDDFESNDDFEFNDDADNDEMLKVVDIADFLKSWSKKHSIAMNALNDLLGYLKQNGFQHLPKDSRTLLETPRSRDILQCNPGKYVHIGFKTHVNYYLLQSNYIPDIITFDVNIDGVPLTKSTTSCFWLILARICDIVKKNIFVIGIYHGYHKPADFNLFLEPFVKEMKELMRNGILYRGKVIDIKLRAIICDAPARASILGTKSHTAYSGCQKCSAEGEFIKNRMTYPITSCIPRTDHSFRMKVDKNHHNTVSILEELDIDMIDTFPLDYLHLVCLGTMKKLLNMWVHGKPSSLLPNKCIEKISTRLNNIGARSQPKEFQRKSRSLSQLSNF